MRINVISVSLLLIVFTAINLNASEAAKKDPKAKSAKPEGQKDDDNTGDGDGDKGGEDGPPKAKTEDRSGVSLVSYISQQHGQHPRQDWLVLERNSLKDIPDAADLRKQYHHVKGKVQTYERGALNPSEKNLGQMSLNYVEEAYRRLMHSFRAQKMAEEINEIVKKAEEPDDEDEEESEEKEAQPPKKGGQEPPGAEEEEEEVTTEEPEETQK